MYVITELRLSTRIYRTFAERNPESTPVGPFDSREAAESYVMWLVRRYQASGASWEVREVLGPSEEFVGRLDALNERKQWEQKVGTITKVTEDEKGISVEAKLDPVICPECRNGKHVNCDKMALDAYGNPAACECGHYA